MSETAIVIDILTYAKSLLVQPESWIKRHLAGTARGTYCEPRDSAACKFCVAGAVDRALHDVLKYRANPDQIRTKAMRSLKDAAGFYHLLTFSSWNDAPGRTHEEVMSLLTRTIKKLGIDLANEERT